MKKTASDLFEYELKLNDDGVLARRKTENLSDGLHFFEDDLEVRGSLTANVITCLGWLLELVELKSGELFFLKGDRTFSFEKGFIRAAAAGRQATHAIPLYRKS